ncbi:uncharacterized protein LOC110038762 isoform X2 [Phalaenopsis equestris]|uniref:uncharacterized protein LOC110038762 isoform X2 n=1 Tax=Phalaenopsis equestris TaxID=78828 RepID=UPI0009E53D0A|nr:uncharacterized protein LOC110038762 isoform X2 [Phalaenopsis equestris]
MLSYHNHPFEQPWRCRCAMDRTDAEIEEEEGEMGKPNLAAAVQCRSGSIGKRVAIAGAAIMSAPVIIPSICFLSGLGLLFSFPFGIYMAGCMCADKIMSALLPIPPLKQEADEELLESEDLIERNFDGDNGHKMFLEPPTLKSEDLSFIELSGEGKANDALVTKEQREDGGEEEESLGFSEERRTDASTLKSVGVLSSVIVASEDENAENLEKVGSMKLTSLEKPVPVGVDDVGVTGLHSHERTRNEEEQLWDQIFSVRAIVGHRATLQPSLGEELMVLYRLIGVEPPPTLKDATDIVEISNSLQVLKSVVGVN